MECLKPGNRLVLACDENYSYPVEVFLHRLRKVTSFAVYSKLKVTLLCLKEDLSSTTQNRLRELAKSLTLNLEIVCLEKENFSFSEHYFGLSATSMLRLFAVANEIDPFVYLDADLLLFPGWENIFEQTQMLQERKQSIAAVNDMGQIKELCSEWLKNTFINSNLPYFNAGVFCFNPEGWLERKSFQEFLDIDSHLKLKEGAKANDQDVLNLEFKGNWMQLDDNFNFQGNDPFMWKVSQKIAMNDGPFIVHFTGPKPWSMPIHLKEEFVKSMVLSNDKSFFRIQHCSYFLAEFEYRAYRQFVLEY